MLPSMLPSCQEPCPVPQCRPTHARSARRQHDQQDDAVRRSLKPRGPTSRLVGLLQSRFGAGARCVHSAECSAHLCHSLHNSAQSHVEPIPNKLSFEPPRRLNSQPGRAFSQNPPIPPVPCCHMSGCSWQAWASPSKSELPSVSGALPWRATETCARGHDKVHLSANVYWHHIQRSPPTPLPLSPSLILSGPCSVPAASASRTLCCGACKVSLAPFPSHLTLRTRQVVGTVNFGTKDLV